MPDKYLAVGTTGVPTEVTATDTAGSAAQAGKIPALDGTGRLSQTMMPTGLGADVVDLVCVTAVTAGDYVSIVSGGVQRASAAAGGTDCDGFVLASAAQGATVTVYMEGRNTAAAGLTAGTRQFLSASSPGKSTDTPPTGTGVRLQTVGKAISATSVAFEADLIAVLA